MDDGTKNRRKPVPRHMDPYYQRDESAEGEADRSEGMIEGRNAVTEALRAGRPLDKVFIAKGETDASLGHIASKARQAGAVVVETDRRKLDAMSVTKAHQGVIALASVKSYSSIEEILQLARDRNEAPFVIVCDEISDPHNLGAIIRTAECTGAHGIIIPKRRSAGMTAVVSKTSAGAVEYMAVARVANITAALSELKKAGVWVYGADTEGATHLWQTDLTGPAALVIGSEGEGLSRLVLENCDFKVRIPMVGKISSLNASVSASVIMYEALRQRSMNER
jgi:23S rRNA (guanosine2251-2'-O)-methyltransferase